MSARVSGCTQHTQSATEPDAAAVTQADMDLLHAAIAAVQWPDLQWSIAEHGHAFAAGREDVVLRLRIDDREVLYSPELKRGLRRATLGAVLHRMVDYGDKALLVADYVTPPMADELRKREVQFIDTAGNAYLRQLRLNLQVQHP